jgi:NitT/TauT family transport system permease protein
MKIDLDDVANTVLFLAVFVGIWQLVFVLGIWPKVSLPSPSSVAESFGEVILNYTLFKGIGITLGRLVVGFLISIALGTVIGLAMIKFKGFGKTMSSFSAGLLSFPSIAWVPFSILLIGFNDAGILFVVIMSSVFSITISTYSSVRNIPPIYIDAARNMGAKGLSLFLHLTIPAATPSLGHILSVGREFQDMGLVIASMITIFAIGLLVDRLLLFKLEEKVRSRWGLSSDR